MNAIVEQLAKRHHNPYRRLLGDAAWQRLHSAIRQRFAGEQQGSYMGVMEVQLSRMGRWLAQLGKLIGTPLAPDCGQQVPVTVSVYRDVRRGGYVWDRFYHFVGGDCRVKSSKCFDNAGELYEYLGHGIGMRLQLKEEDGALLFESRGYFWRWRNVIVSLPAFLSPGRTRVRQIALDARRFRFELSLTHPLFGLLAYQCGNFCTISDDGIEELMQLVDLL